jgi:16S rRNA (guanine(1405)-N(7))-methyltransferase
VTTRIFDPEELVQHILEMPKYRGLGICEDTIRDVVLSEFSRLPDPVESEKSARKKIHNIIAAYLGNPDYALAKQKISEAAASPNPDDLKIACKEILLRHISTSERLPLVDSLYQKLFSITGQPASILDLACGLNPLTFPWMDLPTTTHYYAYDILQPRIALINHFFNTQGMLPLAEIRDILIDPPSIPADVAFIWKEIHRFEQRKKDSSYHLYTALHVKFIIVSLPAQSIHSQHDFTQSYRSLFHKTLHGLQWPVSEIQIGQEMFFIIQKTGL